MADKPMFLYLGVYGDEQSAREDLGEVRDLHSAGVIGRYDAGIAVKQADGGVSIDKWVRHLWHGLSRSDVKELAEELDDGQALLMVVGRDKLPETLKKAELKAEKQVAKQLDDESEDLDKLLAEVKKDLEAA